ncbi:hypothetical protein GQ42DRAFT_165300 [Ramicandelaber brevisporus]|nr:hypothetical protein GQ42DRAFT_165300 [Ramicandelaber brevisporus]
MGSANNEVQSMRDHYESSLKVYAQKAEHFERAYHTAVQQHHEQALRHKEEMAQVNTRHEHLSKKLELWRSENVQLAEMVSTAQEDNQGLRQSLIRKAGEWRQRMDELTLRLEQAQAECAQKAALASQHEQTILRLQEENKALQEKLNDALATKPASVSSDTPSVETSVSPITPSSVSSDDLPAAFAASVSFKSPALKRMSTSRSATSSPRLGPTHRVSSASIFLPQSLLIPRTNSDIGLPVQTDVMATFTQSTNNLLTATRSSQNSQVLDLLKPVVLAYRELIKSIELTNDNPAGGSNDAVSTMITGNEVYARLKLNAGNIFSDVVRHAREQHSGLSTFNVADFENCIRRFSVAVIQMSQAAQTILATAATPPIAAAPTTTVITPSVSFSDRSSIQDDS